MKPCPSDLKLDKNSIKKGDNIEFDICPQITF